MARVSSRSAAPAHSHVAPLRLLDDPEGQARFVSRLDRLAAQLSAFGLDHPDERSAAAALAPRLPVLRDQLLRSPLLRERLEAHGLGPSDLASVDDLAAFPTLDRALLAARWADLATVDRVLSGDEQDDLVVVLSSGSTGQPVPVVRNRLECLLMWAALRHWVEVLEVPMPDSPTVGLLCTLPSGLEYEAATPAFRNGKLTRLSTHQPRPLDRLRDLAPDVLFSDPSGLHWLEAQPDPLPSPSLALTSAQVFTPAQRQRLATRLQAPVVNYYASTETGPIAWECLRDPGAFHVLAPMVYLESVDGELLVTRLLDGPLPLVRYATGDAGTVAWEPCVCGRRGWTIRGFTGRRGCRFTRPDGGSVDAWQLAWIFKHFDLADFVLEQVPGPRTRFMLWLAGASPETAQEVGARVAEALIDLGWPAAEVETRAIHRLPPPTGGKPEPFRA